MDKPGSLHRPQRRVLLLGYSGLVGQALLELCIKSDQVYEILCLGRTQPPFTHYKLRWERSTLLEPGTDAGHYTAIDRVFCCNKFFINHFSASVAIATSYFTSCISINFL